MGPYPRQGVPGLYGINSQPLRDQYCWRNNLSNFYIDFYNNYVLGDFRQNGSNMGPDRSGMPPEHSQTLLGHFWKNSFFVKNLEICQKNRETSTGWKTTLFWEIIQIKKTRIATTRISAVRWPPHLPYGAHSWKNVFWQKKTSILRVIVVHAQESCACTRFLCTHKLF